MYPGIVASGRRQKINQVVLDGEIVALGEDGRPSFQALQHRSSHPKHQIVFYVFDVLHADGEDLTGEPLEARRALLPALVTPMRSSACRRTSRGALRRSSGRYGPPGLRA